MPIFWEVLDPAGTVVGPRSPGVGRDNVTNILVEEEEEDVIVALGENDIEVSDTKSADLHRISTP